MKMKSPKPKQGSPFPRRSKTVILPQGLRSSGDSAVVKFDINHIFATQLLELKHSRSTDLSKGLINNYDMVTLLLANFGELGLKELCEFSIAWRGSRVLEAYFGPHSGYTSADVDGKVLFIPGGYGPCSGAPRWETSLWYRHFNKGIHTGRYVNRLTAYGLERAVTMAKDWT